MCRGSRRLCARAPVANRTPEKMTVRFDRFLRSPSPFDLRLGGSGGTRRSASTMSPRAPASLAAKPYKAPEINLPAELARPRLRPVPRHPLRPEKALWRAEKLPFEVMFFHQGRTVPEPVRINVDRAVRRARRVPFDPALFDYGAQQDRPADAARPRLRRLSRPLRPEHAGLQGRGARVPRRELFPRARQGAALRPVRARPRGRHGRGPGRGVSALHRVLDRAAARRRRRR